MIPKHKHTLNSKIIGVSIMSRFKHRGKFNRMWNMGSVTMSDVIDTLYRNYKHLIEKQKHETPEKIQAHIIEALFEEEV